MFVINPSTAFSHRIGGNKKTVNTIDERRLQSLEIVYDFHLLPDWRQMAIKNTASSDILFAFVDCQERFRLPPIRYASINWVSSGFPTV